MYEKNLNVSLRIRFSEEDYNELLTICDTNGVSLAYLIRYVLRKFILECNKENDNEHE